MFLAETVQIGLREFVRVRTDDADDTMTPLFVLETDDYGLVDVLMRSDDLLDLFGIDILATA